MELIQSLLSNLWSLFLVVFFFGGSIFVHELGHFLAARRRGVVVERFSIGMGPPLFRWTGKDGVEYWISWLPLGGYVKLPQLADMREIEGETRTDLSKLPPPSYTTKLLVFLAGAAFNLVFAFFLACVLWLIGFPMRQDTRTTSIGYVMPELKVKGVAQASPASKAGLRPGDTILSIDGTEVDDWVDITQALALSSGRTADGKERLVTLKIRRGNETFERDLNPILSEDEKIRKIGIAPLHQVVIGEVVPGSYSDSVGLKAGDRIVGLDTATLYSLSQLADHLESRPNAPVTLKVQRGKENLDVVLPPHKTSRQIIEGTVFLIPNELVHQNPWRLFRSIFQNTLQSIASLVNPRSDIDLSNASGPIGIVRQFWMASSSEYPVRVTMWFTVLINISLAVFNLLPIPVLDGGHILFATIGKLRGRALPPDFINAAQSVFIVLLFTMVIYVSYHDVQRMMKSDKAEPAPAAPAPAKAPAIPAPAKP